MEHLIYFLLNIFGWILIWAAIDVGRPAEYQLKLFSKDWFIVLILFIIGSCLTKFR